MIPLVVVEFFIYFFRCGIGGDGAGASTHQHPGSARALLAASTAALGASLAVLE